MSVKIRLARHGRTNKAFYSLVAADSQCRRDGRFIKKLGVYDPHKKDGNKMTITDLEALKKYLECGAQPTDTVKRYLRSYGI